MRCGAGRSILFIDALRATSEPGSFQVRYFARRYRCSTYNVRGYPPSDVPDLVE
jgi:hypothetical protein